MSEQDRKALEQRMQRWVGRYQDQRYGDQGLRLQMREALAIIGEALADPAPSREVLEQAFRAGFAACSEGTTKYGEYIGLSIEEEFADWIATSAP
jgi:hypothetical protein